MKLDLDSMHGAADRASELLKSLANRHRLLILCQLLDGERSVGELVEYLGIRDTVVSQHLALLRKDGLVAARREGQTIRYAIASRPAEQILAALAAIYCAPAPICGEAETPSEPQTARRH